MGGRTHQLALVNGGTIPDTGNYAVYGPGNVRLRVEKDRLRQLPPKTLEKMLPYAMALGIEGQWVGAFKGLVEPYPWYTHAAAAVVAASQSDDSTRAEIILSGLDCMTRIILQSE